MNDTPQQKQTLTAEELDNTPLSAPEEERLRAWHKGGNPPDVPGCDGCRLLATLDASRAAHALAVEERDEARRWVFDLQSGMYVNCVYCGHRYGPGETTPVSMADALKAHVEACPSQPMSALKAENARLAGVVSRLPVTADGAVVLAMRDVVYHPERDRLEGDIIFDEVDGWRAQFLDYAPDECTEYVYPLIECYSTFAAAARRDGEEGKS